MSSTLKEDLEGLKRISSVNIDLSHHHYLALSFLHDWMFRKGLPAAKGVLLDYGCGGQPYRQILQKNIRRYIGADVAAAAGVELDIELEPGSPVPLPNESVNTILSTQTLEHVYDFDFYLRDCYRLLANSGCLIISVPMEWRHHEVPHDYWRFTKFGISRKLEDIGFKIEDVESAGGVYILIAQIFLDHLSERQIYKPSINRIINRLALWLDKRIPDANNTQTWMCIARKV
ncbi:class I SAM-dependent methyltransferase [Noviherbaspirillum massiliense]|uniref:class I SAM-dependent methyltransferase n=1 Tax=Noviherbaspirillum massiliense TaxID=1465823 RepID=UPI001375C721|nr:methyltransferase domain-containing protein [Noviherbaspirillum massiliense]